MESIIISIVISFITTILITPYLKKFLENIGLVAMDVQKKDKPIMASSGGLPVIIGFLCGVMTYVFITTFITKATTNLTLLFASLTSVLTITLLVLLDDINIQPARRTKKGEVDTRIGLSQWQKILISLLGAIPLMALQVGNSQLSIPFVGTINFGLLYPLIIVPLIIVFTSNATNMLAGMNGLEAGTGLILLTATGLYSLFYGTIEGAIIALTMASCLLAFLKYNAYPASFLPGDTLTYMIGVVFGTTIIIGDIEKFAVIAFIPWFIEFFLKARKKFKASSLGLLQKDGSLKPKYNKIYSLTQVGMKLVKKEKYVTIVLMFITALFSIASFIISRLTI